VVGDFGLDAASELLGAADVVLAVGTRLGPGDTLRQHPDVLNPRRQKIVQIDVDPIRAGYAVPVDVALVGDAAAVLGQLRDALPATTGTPGRERVAASFATHGGHDVDTSFSDRRPVMPQRLIHELSTALPPEATVTADAGENRIFMVHHYRTRDGDFLQPSGATGMGYAIPAAIGVALGDPGRPVVAVMGDGGFALSMSALLTAVEAKLPIVSVIFNNAALNWVRHVQRDRPIACELGTFDYAGIAAAMGCVGIRVEAPDDVAPALAKALAAGVPAVVDVVTADHQTWELVTSARSAIVPGQTPSRS